MVYGFVFRSGGSGFLVLNLRRFKEATKEKEKLQLPLQNKGLAPVKGALFSGTAIHAFMAMNIQISIKIQALDP